MTKQFNIQNINSRTYGWYQFLHPWSGEAMIYGDTAQHLHTYPRNNPLH